MTSLLLLAQHPVYCTLNTFSGAAQFVKAGAKAVPGSHEYESAVDEQMRELAVKGSRPHIEPVVSSGVSAFDGWLALTSSGRFRFQRREHVRAFLACGEAESLIQEFIIDHARRVSLPSGEVVQVVCAAACTHACTSLCVRSMSHTAHTSACLTHLVFQ